MGVMFAFLCHFAFLFAENCFKVVGYQITFRGCSEGFAQTTSF